MRKIGWYAVSASVVALILGGILLLAANLYVQSQAVQQRIRQALSSVMRMPVSIKKTTITPWEGLRIDGLTARPEVPEPTTDLDAVAADYLLASSFRVRFPLWQLISRKQFVINEVLLDRPQVAWAQDADGRWRFPAEHGSILKKDNSRKGARSTSSAVSPATPPTQIDAPARPGQSSASPASSPQMAATDEPPAASLPPRQNAGVHSIDKIRLRHGNLSFLNNKRHQVGHFEEVNLDSHLPDLDHAVGTVSFAKVNLPRVGLTLTEFQSDFSYGQSEGLSLNNGHAHLAGGDVTANYHLSTNQTASPFTLQCRLANVGLGQLIHEAGSRAKLLEGRLQGDLQASGLSDDPESRAASGQIQLVNARVRDFPLFRVLGELLRIDDLSHMEFKKAQLDYRLDGTVLQVDPLTLVSNDLQITAHGKYLTENDRLDLHARLTLDEAVSRQLPPSVLGQFQPDEATPGSRYIEFAVTGPAAKPNTDLYKRVLAPQVNDLLQSFLSPKPRTPKDKFLKRQGPPPPPTDPDADKVRPLP